MSTDLSRAGRQIYQLKRELGLLHRRVESLEHLANQQSILVTTLGDIMKEIEDSEK